MIALVSFIGVACMALPNMWAFAPGRDIRQAMRFIDFIYPYPQNHKPFLKHPSLIKVHVGMNGLALLSVASHHLSSSQFQVLWHIHFFY